MGLAVVQRAMCRTVPLSALNVSQRHTGLSAGYSLFPVPGKIEWVSCVQFSVLHF